MPEIPETATKEFFANSKIKAKCGICSEWGTTRWFADIKMPICYLCWIEWSSDGAQTQAVKQWRNDYKQKILENLIDNNQLILIDNSTSHFTSTGSIDQVPH